ncbi:hypothetical protein [Herbaspirillum sp. RV1423]|uniref:hypothetical protein n=1 Tax=Herbaspirillum sp. RV1423 TaxID=1443993 RepID=UPI0005552526|nr:hypothetical protein [Herbaspirillum sp. RV1423]
MRELQSAVEGTDVAEKTDTQKSDGQELAVQHHSSTPFGLLAKRRMTTEAKKKAKADQRAHWEKDFHAARTAFHRQLIDRFNQRKTLNDAALADYNSKQFNVLQKDIADTHHNYQEQLDHFVKFIRPDLESLEIHVPRGTLRGLLRTKRRKQRINKWVDFYYGKYLIDLMKDETVTTEEIRGIRDSFEARLDAISQKEDANKQANIDRAVRLATTAKGIAK